MISRVHCFFEQELDFDRSLSIRNPRRRTHLATGVSETTVTRCVRRREQGGSNHIKKRKYNYHPYCISPNKIQNMQKRREKGRRRDGIRMPHICTGNHGSKPRGYQDPYKNAPAIMVWVQHCLSRNKNPKQTGQTLKTKWSNPSKQELHVKTGKPGLKIYFNCSENKVYSQNCEAMQRRNLEKQLNVFK